jgi:hypothetical protein
MIQTVSRQDPEVLLTSDSRPLAVWQDLYPDQWLLIAVTHEEDGEPQTGRVLAVASTDTALAPLWRAATQRGDIIALIYGHATTCAPTVIA